MFVLESAVNVEAVNDPAPSARNRRTPLVPDTEMPMKYQVPGVSAATGAPDAESANSDKDVPSDAVASTWYDDSELLSRHQTVETAFRSTLIFTQQAIENAETVPIVTVRV
ncbi:hypothetical protein ABZW49_10410 [Nonomuraea wenchangensis]